MLTKDLNTNRFSPINKMGSSEWQPTKSVVEKPFMTATIMSSEKRRTTKSPINKSSNANDLLKDKRNDRSKSPVGDQTSKIDNKTDRQKTKEAALERLSQPKNRTQPFKAKKDKDNSRDKSRSKSPIINATDKSPVLSKALDNKIKNEHLKPKFVKCNDEPKVEV